MFALDYFVNYGRLTTIGPVRRMFNTTREDGLASWLGITQTLLVALTLWLIYLTVRRTPGSTRWRKLGWLILAAFVTYMAADDGATIHERMGSTFRELQERSSAGSPSFGARLLEAFPSYPWQILFLPVFGAFGLFMLVFLWRELATRPQRLVIAAAVACFVVAVGLDFCEGLDRDHRLNPYAWLSDRLELSEFTRRRFGRDGYTALVHFSKSFEEVIEMFGMTLLWVTFLGHWMRLAPEVRLTFHPPVSDPKPQP